MEDKIPLTVKQIKILSEDNYDGKIFTDNERLAFHHLEKSSLVLKSTVLTDTEKHWMWEFENLSKNYRVKVLSHIRIVDVFDVDNSNWWGKRLFNIIGPRHLDFLICNNHFKPLIAIELDDKSHENNGAKFSDEVKNIIFSKASHSIVFLRIDCKEDKK